MTLAAVREIAQQLGLGPRRVYRWVRRIDMPERSAMAPKPCTPAYFGAFLARSWAEGTTKVRHLFSDIRHRGYTGSYSHLARFLAPWRNNASQVREMPAACGLACGDEQLHGKNGGRMIHVIMDTADARNVFGCHNDGAPG
jgi:hypothetical protein